MHPLQIREAASAIARAEKPVLYVGGGTINGDACDELLELAEAGGLPVVTTLMGKGAFPETHPLFFGWPGMHGAKWSNIAMNTCDVLVAIGARFDDRVTGKLSAFAPGATVVHLDIDPAEISKLRDADIPVVGPLKKALAELAAEVGKHRAAGRPGARGLGAPDRGVARRVPAPLRHGRRLAQAAEGDGDAAGDLTAGGGRRSSRRGSASIRCGRCSTSSCERPRNFITSGGLGTMGYGIPAAVGAKAARPEATVVCVDGDGCFQMTAQELTTAVIDDLPIVVVLVNNGYLGMVTQWQDMFFDGRRSHVGLGAQRAGLRQARRGVRRGRHARRERGRARAGAPRGVSLGRTVVIDCRVDPAEQCFPMIPAGAAAIDMVEYRGPVEATP